MMLPHDLICAIGKVHRDFCIKDAQIFAAWMSSSKAEQKDIIIKRLKQEMDIDKMEEGLGLDGLERMSMTSANIASEFYFSSSLGVMRRIDRFTHSAMNAIKLVINFGYV